jgi:hypothetical protein
MRRYWKLKEDTLDRTLWRNGLGECYGPLVRHENMHKCYWMHPSYYCVQLERSDGDVIPYYYVRVFSGNTRRPW